MQRASHSYEFEEQIVLFILFYDIRNPIYIANEYSAAAIRTIIMILIKTHKPKENLNGESNFTLDIISPNAISI